MNKPTKHIGIKLRIISKIQFHLPLQYISARVSFLQVSTNYITNIQILLIYML